MVDKYSEFFNEREFTGYGMQTPDPKWPNNAKIAVNFIVNFFVGAEMNVALGDTSGDSLLLDMPSACEGHRNDMLEAQYEYGPRQGVPRLLNLFKKYGITANFNVSTKALEASSYWIPLILQDGHEVMSASHRYLDYLHVAQVLSVCCVWHVAYMCLSPETEAEHVDKAIDLIQSTTGDKTLPHGWFVDRRSNATINLYTHAHKERNLPLLYSSDSCADELPFWMPSPVEGQGLLYLPVHYDTSDMRFNDGGGGFASPNDFYMFLKDSFDVMYEEGKDGQGKMMTVILHPHIIGRGSRCYYLEQFIKYITNKPDVWIARRDAIAEHWTKTFPYDKTTAFGQTKFNPC